MVLRKKDEEYLAGKSASKAVKIRRNNVM